MTCLICMPLGIRIPHVTIMICNVNIHSNALIGMKQYYNISIYSNIYYSNAMQYGLKEISIYCTLQYIMIYCNILQCLLS